VVAVDEDAETGRRGLRGALYAEGANVASDRLGDLDGALARLAKAVDASGDDTERALLLSARAELLARLGRIDEAHADVDSALAIIPPSGLAHLALGRIAVAQGDPAGAPPPPVAAPARAEPDGPV